MSDARDTYLRQVFRRVMLSAAPDVKPKDFYPLTRKGEFRYPVPEEIYQYFKKMIVQADVLDGEQCGHCGRLPGSPDGGCDWVECAGHAAAPVAPEPCLDEGIERAFNGCAHEFLPCTNPFDESDVGQVCEFCGLVGCVP